MKICEKHWALMRKAVEDRGLTHLVKSVEVNFNKTIRTIEGKKVEVSDYDPLNDMAWMVMCRALEMGGAYLLTKKEDGSEYCPVCEAMAHHCLCGKPDCAASTPEKTEKFWTEGVADVVQDHCKSLGLISIN